MQETIDKMVTFVQEQGGQSGWNELRDHLDTSEQRTMMSAIRQAEHDGVLMRVNRFVPGEGTKFTVDYVGDDVPETENEAPVGGE